MPVTCEYCGEDVVKPVIVPVNSPSLFRGCVFCSTECRDRELQNEHDFDNHRYSEMRQMGYTAL